MTGDNARLMKAATIASTSVAVLMIAGKMVAWLLTGSVSMLSSLVDSSLDFVGSLITLIAVRQALTPADAEHRFGHGKAEALAGLAQAGFIAASGGALILTVAEQLLRPQQVKEEATGLVISAAAIVLTIGLVTFQSYVAKRTNSIAIAADRAHYLTDLVSTMAAGGALFLSGFFNEPLIDSGVAGLVSLYLMHGAWTVSRGSLDVLMDRELPEAERQKILEIARDHPGVRSVHELRTRSSGLTKFIQAHVVLEPTMSLGRAHVIGDTIEAAIQDAFPDAEIILHIDPWNDDEPRRPAD